MSAAITADRRVTLHRRVRLIVAFTITYNILEGIIAVAAGAAASSAAVPSQVLPAWASAARWAAQTVAARSAPDLRTLRKVCTWACS